MKTMPWAYQKAGYRAAPTTSLPPEKTRTTAESGRLGATTGDSGGRAHHENLTTSASGAELRARAVPGHSARVDAICERGENRHHTRTNLLRYRVVRADGATLAGTSDMGRARVILSVLSRDGELSGYRIVTRGTR